MQDMFFIVVMMFAVWSAMQKHNPKFVAGNGIGDFIGWFLACTFLFVLVRLPIYLLVYGPRFPFNPSAEWEFGSGVISVAFWWAMVYWRIPMRLLGRK